MGYVYFITNQKSIKIGFTKNHPEKRLKQLQTGTPDRLFLLGYIMGNLETEKRLHQKFGNLRLRGNGEWFEGSDELIDYINSVNNDVNVLVIKNDLLNDSIMTVPKIIKV